MFMNVIFLAGGKKVRLYLLSTIIIEDILLLKFANSDLS